MNKITVAIASYNHASFIKEAISSALSQTGCDLEVIVVDDASTDGSVEEIRKINDPRLRLICHEHNLGNSLALNRAIQEGSGEYVAVLNSDDAFLPGKLQKQLAFLQANPNISTVLGLPRFVDNHNRLLSRPIDDNAFKQPNRSRHEWLRYFFYHGNALCHPTMMIRRDCHKKYGYYDRRLVQAPDYDFWHRLLLNEEIHILNEPLLNFRILPNHSNVSALTPSSLRRSQWEVSQSLKHYLELSPENYLKVFPEDSDLANRIGLDKGKDFVSLALAYKTFSDHVQPCFQTPYRLFGLQLFHELLGQCDKKEMAWLTSHELKIKTHMNFTCEPIFINNHKEIPLIIRKGKNLLRKIKRLFLK